MVLSRKELEATMVRMGVTAERAKATLDSSIKRGRYSQEGDRLTFRNKKLARTLLKVARRKS